MYVLKETAEFSREFKKLPADIRKRFRKQLRKVQENPFGVGKPLGAVGLRELKNKGFRLYYYVNEEQIIVVLITLSNKDDQQENIDFIKQNLGSIKRLTEE